MTATLSATTGITGKTEPLFFTPPLRELTPETTRGYQVIHFAEDILGITLIPWQRWWLVHALELLPNGRFRFRTILTLMARQSGKTMLLKIVSLYFLYVGGAMLVLGAAQSLDIARESWQGAVEIAEDNEALTQEIASVRKANGEQCLTLHNGARYRISAATRSAGRGLSVDLLILDELREHRDWAAWGALTKTTTARPNALIVGISNAGDNDSIVLNSLRATALAGEDPSLFIAEWSAPDGCDLDDPEAWAQASPGLGYTVSEQAIRSALAQDPPLVFRTEMLCQRVDSLDAAIDISAWRSCADASGDLSAVRNNVAACIDVAPDSDHITLALAGLMADGKVRVEIAGAWSNTTDARAALPDLLRRIAPKIVGWFPSGPAAALGVDLRAMEDLIDRRKVRDAPDFVYEIRGAEVTETCQEMADLVLGRRVLHSDDPLLNAHVAGSQRLRNGDGWRFCRVGKGHVDAAYAVAGAVHIARTTPEPVVVARPRIF